MDASIVAIGLIVLHAFATAVLWFELRSHEKESKERIERLTASVLDAIGLLRQDLAAVLGPQGSDPSPRGGGHSPVSPGASPRPTGDAPPKSTPRPVPMGQQTARAVKRWEKRAGELRDDALATAEDGPTSDERTAAVPPAPGLPLRLVSVTRDDDPAHTRPTVVEGDDDAAPATETPDQIRARLEADEDRREQARARGEAGPLPMLDEDDARPTGELFGDDEQTRVHDASAVRDAVVKATQRAGHAAPASSQAARACQAESADVARRHGRCARGPAQHEDRAPDRRALLVEAHARGEGRRPDRTLRGAAVRRHHRDLRLPVRALRSSPHLA